MRAAWCLARMDLARAGRDAVALYMLASPALLAIAVAVFGGGMEPATRLLVESFLLVSAQLLVALVAGFAMVEERSTRACEALAMSPAGMASWLAGKAVFVLALSIVADVAILAILRRDLSAFPALALATLAATPLSLSAGLLLGIFADSQLAAIGAVKLVLPAFLTVAFVAAVVPEGARPWFLAFPNVWMLRAFSGALSGAGAPALLLDAAVTAASGIALAAWAGSAARKKLRFRR